MRIVLHGIINKIFAIVRARLNDVSCSFHAMWMSLINRRQLSQTGVLVHAHLLSARFLLPPAVSSLQASVEMNLRLVNTHLHEMKIRFWKFDRPWPQVPFLNLTDDNFEIFLKSIVLSSHFKYWYFAPLDLFRAKSLVSTFNHA